MPLLLVSVLLASLPECLAGENPMVMPKLWRVSTSSTSFLAKVGVASERTGAHMSFGTCGMPFLSPSWCSLKSGRTQHVFVTYISIPFSFPVGSLNLFPHRRINMGQSRSKRRNDMKFTCELQSSIKTQMSIRDSITPMLLHDKIALDPCVFLPLLLLLALISLSLSTPQAASIMFTLALRNLDLNRPTSTPPLLSIVFSFLASSSSPRLAHVSCCWRQHQLQPLGEAGSNAALSKHCHAKDPSPGPASAKWQRNGLAVGEGTVVILKLNPMASATDMKSSSPKCLGNRFRLELISLQYVWHVLKTTISWDDWLASN